MILLLDAGNTRIKWRVLDGNTARAEGALEHRRLAELEDVLADHPAITRMLGANVAGAEVAAHTARLLGARDIACEWIGASQECCGVRNHYTQPARLGADRWAALIGARNLHAGPCLVACAGTATTIDVLDAEGNFRGGAILPGMDLMVRSLAGNTAQLPLAHGQFDPLPRNTADAIESGCLQAQAGAVERMFAQLAGSPDALCLLSGGAADRFAPLLGIPLRRFDNLVLHGLGVIACATSGKA